MLHFIFVTFLTAWKSLIHITVVLVILGCIRYDMIHFILFHFILFYFISFCFISFYFISFYFILFYFISFYFISFHFILFYFILFHFIKSLQGDSPRTLTTQSWSNIRDASESGNVRLHKALKNKSIYPLSMFYRAILLRKSLFLLYY